LHKYAPKEWRTIAPNAGEADAVLRLKSFLTDVPDLIRCEHIVPSFGSQEVLPTKYRLIREPIPVGLQTDRYSVSYWLRC
jgi:hypothetical protein